MYYSHRGVPSLTIESANKGQYKSKNFSKGRKENMIDEIQKDVEEIDLGYMESKLKNEKFQKYVSSMSTSDNINSACHRNLILKNIDMQKLKEETFNFAMELQSKTSSPTVTPEELQKNCDATVNQFEIKAEKLINDLGPCIDEPIEFQIPSVDLTLVIDGSRTAYENQELIL